MYINFGSVSVCLGRFSAKKTAPAGAADNNAVVVKAVLLRLAIRTNPVKPDPNSYTAAGKSLEINNLVGLQKQTHEPRSIENSGSGDKIGGC